MLPTMIHNHCPVSSHERISELIVQQLFPCKAESCEPVVINIGEGVQMGMAIQQSTMNTAPGFDDTGYPCIRFWTRTDGASLRRLIKSGLDNDITDWYVAHTVLIEKADKPRYNTVKL